MMALPVIADRDIVDPVLACRFHYLRSKTGRAIVVLVRDQDGDAEQWN